MTAVLSACVQNAGRSRMAAAFVVGIIDCGALTVHGIARLARGRHAALGVAGDTQR